jgi:hypothetical protein
MKLDAHERLRTAIDVAAEPDRLKALGLSALRSL